MRAIKARVSGHVEHVSTALPLRRSARFGHGQCFKRRRVPFLLTIHYIFLSIQSTQPYITSLLGDDKFRLYISYQVLKRKS